MRKYTVHTVNLAPMIAQFSKQHNENRASAGTRCKGREAGKVAAMTIFKKDEKTGIRIGVNDRGELFLGNDKSGYNLPDTPDNRDYIYRDFDYYTKG